MEIQPEMAIENPQPPPQTSFHASTPPSGSRIGTGERIGDFSCEAPGIYPHIYTTTSSHSSISWHSSLTLPFTVKVSKFQSLSLCFSMPGGFGAYQFRGRSVCHVGRPRGSENTWSDRGREGIIIFWRWRKFLEDEPTFVTFEGFTKWLTRGGPTPNFIEKFFPALHYCMSVGVSSILYHMIVIGFKTL